MLVEAPPALPESSRIRIAMNREETQTDSPETASRPMLEAQDLTVRFGGQTVLESVNLEIPKGQTLVVIGQSGCGKTVLLKTLIGLQPPTQGAVRFDGRNLQKLDRKELAQQRLRMGFVFQNAALFDSMTIGRNVAFPVMQHLRMRESEALEMAAARLAETGLPSSIMHKTPSQLSGGMRKRVGVARALMLEPEVMLYDEPTTGLDPIMTDVIHELILRIRRSRPVTSVIVSHDMRTARKTADRVVMFYPRARLEEDQQQVIFDGPPSELERTKDRRVSQFVKGESGELLASEPL